MQKAAIQAREAAWAAHDADKVVAVYTPEAKIAQAGPAGWSELSPADEKTQLQAMFTAFPDAKLTATRIISTSERAAVEWTLTGTNQGELMGAKATGKPFGIRGGSFLVFTKDGRVSRETQYFDIVTIQGQIGKAPRGQKVRPVEPAPSTPLEVVVATSGEEPKSAALLKKLYERTQMRDHQGMAAVFADDGVISNCYEPTDMKKKDMINQLPSADKAFLNSGSVVKQCVSAGDHAACEYEWTATWKGPAFGMSPTGKTGTVHELDVVQVKDGRLTRVDGYGSGLEFDVAFGVTKPPAADSGKHK